MDVFGFFFLGLCNSLLFVLLTIIARHRNWEILKQYMPLEAVRYPTDIRHLHSEFDVKYFHQRRAGAIGADLARFLQINKNFSDISVNILRNCHLMMFQDNEKMTFITPEQIVYPTIEDIYNRTWPDILAKIISPFFPLWTRYVHFFIAHTINVLLAFVFCLCAF